MDFPTDKEVKITKQHIHATCLATCGKCPFEPIRKKYQKNVGYGTCFDVMMDILNKEKKRKVFEAIEEL